ncbi:MAG TPA: sugar kinase [Humisphaera sp.]
MANRIPRIVTFGEVMARLAPPGHHRILQAQSFDLTFGGAEVNVAVSLAHLGLDAAFVTKLPNNDLAQACVNQVRGLGVDVKHVVRGGDRMGLYFVEHGASQRASTVTYDRAGSSISAVKPDDFDWDAILSSADWFHFTGITPALSDAAAAACLKAARTAKAHGATVSCDLNFRKKLWSSEKANQVMSGLMSNVDVCVANEEDAETVFGIKAAGVEVTSGTIDHERYVEVAQRLTERFKLKAVAITLRESHSASRNGWSGLLYAGGKPHFSRRYEIDVVDRVGAGDAFAAGLIYAMAQKHAPQDAIEFAAAASCLKHSVHGDFSVVKLDEVRALIAGDGSGRVRR